jgi:voltage-gated potassium channel Kch
MSLLLLLVTPVLVPERLQMLGTSIVFTLVVSAGVGAVAETRRTFRAAILNHVLRADQVDAETLYGAVCVYFLFAALLGVLYVLVEILAPGSFNLPDSVSLTAGSRFDAGPMMYYSFVTITTLGYGDITPATELARLLALLEAVLGQLFLVILVARLVGVYTARRLSGKGQ